MEYIVMVTQLIDTSQIFNAAAMALMAANVSIPVGIIWLAGNMNPYLPRSLSSNANAYLVPKVLYTQSFVDPEFWSEKTNHYLNADIKVLNWLHGICYYKTELTTYQIDHFPVRVLMHSFSYENEFYFQENDRAGEAKGNSEIAYCCLTIGNRV